MQNATYENLSENLDIINKRAKDRAEQFLEISYYDPLVSMFELTEKYLRTNYDVFEHQAESFDLISLKQEVMEILENIRKKIEMEIVSMLNPDAPCTPKQELTDIIDQLQTSFADTYFKLMYLQQVFELKRNTLALNKSTASPEKYANEIESKIADREFALCLDSINNYIENKYNQRKIEELLKIVFPEIDDECFKSKMSIEYSSKYPRNRVHIVASLIDRETQKEYSKTYIAEITATTTNILINNKYGDSVLIEEKDNDPKIWTYLSLINKLDYDSLKENLIDRLLELIMKTVVK